jgi:hypothetical protein
MHYEIQMDGWPRFASGFSELTWDQAGFLASGRVPPLGFARGFGKTGQAHAKTGQTWGTPDRN